MQPKRTLILLLVICLCMAVKAQDNLSAVDKVINFPTSFLNKVQSKYSNLEDRLTRQTEKYLLRLAKRERKLKKKLAKVDSAKAQQLFGDIDQQYDKMLAAVRSDSLLVKKNQGDYLPMVDSVKTSLAFLTHHAAVVPQSKDMQEKVKTSLSQVNQLEDKLQQSEQVKAFIQQRKQQIKGSLSSYTSLPKGITNQFADFSKEAYYYSAQLKEYKDMLNDPDKMVQKGLVLLKKLPAFTQFMKQHSELASLFTLPDNYGTPESLAGLQTRAIQNQLASGGPNAQQCLQQNLWQRNHS